MGFVVGAIALFLFAYIAVMGAALAVISVTDALRYVDDFFIKNTRGIRMVYRLIIAGIVTSIAAIYAYLLYTVPETDFWKMAAFLAVVTFLAGYFCNLGWKCLKAIRDA